MTVSHENTTKQTRDTEQLDTKHDNDYRFIDYRLNQLEQNIREGLGRLEREQQQNYKELLKLLQIMQDSNNTQNEKLVEISEKQKTLEEKIKNLDALKEEVAVHETQVQNIYHRLNIYKQILFTLGTATGVALITAFFNLLTK